MKILVAIPVYDGKLPTQVVRCLMDEQVIAKGCGDEFQTLFLPTCSHPAMGRNQLAQDFMDGDCDRLIFLDSDVTCFPGDMVKLAHMPVDFVGGAYRYKFAEENYPVGWITDGRDLWSDKLGLIEVATLPGGFMSLSRNVFDTLREKNPERAYEHFGKKSFAYFQMPFLGGALYGEDSYFCKEWRETGGKIYLNPEITLTHWDFNKPYKGHIGNWLKNRAKEVEECLTP